MCMCGRVGILIIVLHAVLLAYAASCHSPVYNEIGHLGSGLYHWQTRRFEPFRVNPPLVRMVATAPMALFVSQREWDYVRGSPDLREEYRVGADMVQSLDGRVMIFLTLARWSCLPFALLGACVCWRWATDLFGNASGLVALASWCLSPSVLAHASLATTDAHAAAIGVSAFYAFWCWLRAPTWRRALIAGVALGAAQLAKTLFLLFYPVMFVVVILNASHAGEEGRRSSRASVFGMLLVIMALSLSIINTGYLFRGSFLRLDNYRFRSQAMNSLFGVSNRVNVREDALSGACFSAFRVPLPKDYVLGIDRQKLDFESGSRCYLDGEWREQAGWWYFYLYALAIKSPIGLLAIGVMATVLAVRRCAYRAKVRDEMCLWLPPLAMVVLVSSQTGMTIHSRYLLPALPFVFIWISRVGRSLTLRHRNVIGGAVALLTLSISSSLCCYPHCLSYFNELVGGPRGGYAQLHDSNVAWNQDLLFLRRWYRTHPEARPFHLASVGLADPTCVGLEYVLPPFGPPVPDYDPGPWADEAVVGPIPGWYAIDINFLCGHRCSLPTGNGGIARSHRFGYDFSYFRYFHPVATAGYSIYIYHLTLDEANRVRRDLGLDELMAQEDGQVASILERSATADQVRSKGGPRRGSRGQIWVRSGLHDYSCSTIPDLSWRRDLEAIGQQVMARNVLVTGRGLDGFNTFVSGMLENAR